MFKMWWLSKTVCLGILLALSFMDIQRHQVPVKVLVISNIISIMYYIIFKSSKRKKTIRYFYGYKSQTRL